MWILIYHTSYTYYISLILAYYISFKYYCWKFVIIYLSVTIADTWLEYFFKVLLLIHLLYIFVVLGTIVGTSWAEMYYERNLFTKSLKFFSLLHYELFHTSNKRVIIIHTKLQLPSCFLSAAGDVWQRLKRYVLLTSTHINTCKETKAEII